MAETNQMNPGNAMLQLSLWSVVTGLWLVFGVYKLHRLTSAGQHITRYWYGFVIFYAAAFAFFIVVTLKNAKRHNTERAGKVS